MAPIVAVTGASGFLGSALCVEMGKRGLPPRMLVRSSCSLGEKASSGNVVVAVGDVNDQTDWALALNGVNCVIHCAARVHIMNEVATNPLTEFRQVNVAGTLKLARQASELGVKRFIFLSSIKVNGECTQLGAPFTPDQMPAPVDPYGISKYEAEIGLKALSAETGMEVVIIRPPLVYGPMVKANFLSMMNWLRRGVWLPLGGVTKNRRSFVFIDNLVSMIIACVSHPAAANQTFLVSDGEDLSTTELLERMALALGRPAKLIAVPATLISLVAKLVGRANLSQRLYGSLQVDMKKTKDLLEWSPPVSIDEGLRQTAAYFLRTHT